MNPNPNEPAMSAELAALFLSAAAVYQERGRARGWFEEPETGCVCAIGAIRIAASGDPIRDTETSLAAVQALAERVGHPTACESALGAAVERIAEWHDRPDRTSAEVVAELVAAAEAAESECAA